MLRNSESLRMGKFRWTVLGLAGALALVGLQAGAAELSRVNAALNCNSNIEVRETGLDPMDPSGLTYMAMITVTNVESNNIGNVPQTQQFPTVTFFPSCTSTIPCAPGDGSPAGSALEFVMGSATSNCPQTLDPVTMGAGFVDFTFTPTLELAANDMPDGDMTPEACDIFFEVRVTPDPGVMTTYLMEATTTGECQNFGVPGTFTSDTTGTDDVVFSPMPSVPTMGQWALAILALILTAGSVEILRRKQAFEG